MSEMTAPYGEPFERFREVLAEAEATGMADPNAMVVSTVDGEAQPSSRVVLLKGFDERGFVFYTNYESRKGRELQENPRAALVFYWAPFDRQVRIEGVVERTSRAESAAYFATRPRGSRLGAWASRQSAPVAGRKALERDLAVVEERFGEGEVPLPDFWGGYRLVPDAIEFWQGRPSRLHDRLLYRRPLAAEGEPGGAWTRERLAP